MEKNDEILEAEEVKKLRLDANYFKEASDRVNSEKARGLDEIKEKAYQKHLAETIKRIFEAANLGEYVTCSTNFYDISYLGDPVSYDPRDLQVYLNKEITQKLIDLGFNIYPNKGFSLIISWEKENGN